MDEGKRGVLSIKADIADVRFLPASSYETHHPTGMTIYADPPYAGNKLGGKTGVFQSFNHKEFWHVMRKWSKNNLVVISESRAPSDFKRIWSATSTVALGTGKKAKKYTDNLYVHENIYRLLSRPARREIASI
jgi:site-specific DNA-adenine methylase